MMGDSVPFNDPKTKGARFHKSVFEDKRRIPDRHTYWQLHAFRDLLSFKFHSLKS